MMPDTGHFCSSKFDSGLLFPYRSAAALSVWREVPDYEDMHSKSLHKHISSAWVLLFNFKNISKPYLKFTKPLTKLSLQSPHFLWSCKIALLARNNAALREAARTVYFQWLGAKYENPCQKKFDEAFCLAPNTSYILGKTFSRWSFNKNHHKLEKELFSHMLVNTKK